MIIHAPLFIIGSFLLAEYKSMRIFKRRSSDPSPQLVSLSPLMNENEECIESVRQSKSGQSTPTENGSYTPNNHSPKPYRRGKSIVVFTQ